MATGPAEIARVLLVDDDVDDWLIIGGMLAEQEHARFSVEYCAAYDEALAAIGEQRHDVYLIDYRLGTRTGLELSVRVSRPARQRR
jgi:two-component system, cell cycle sensor histidine kinase and response regulator CckA